MQLSLFLPARRTRHGASLVSYGILSGLISAAAIGAVIGLGETVGGAFTGGATALSENALAAQDTGGGDPLPRIPPATIPPISTPSPLPPGPDAAIC